MKKLLIHWNIAATVATATFNGNCANDVAVWIKGIVNVCPGLDNWFVLHCPSDRPLNSPCTCLFFFALWHVPNIDHCLSRVHSIVGGYCRLLSVKIEINNEEAKDEGWVCLVVPQRVRGREITTLTFDFILKGNNGIITKSLIIDLQTYALGL